MEVSLFIKVAPVVKHHTIKMYGRSLAGMLPA
jgi:hypothetical protein